VAVTSAGPFASLHLAPDRLPRQHPTSQCFTGQMPFLPCNQQHQSTEGVKIITVIITCSSQNYACVRAYICQVGTSSVVYPAAMFAPELASRGVTVAEFNVEKTPATGTFT